MSKQLDIPLMGVISNEVKDLPESLVSVCRTKTDAYRLCLSQARVRKSQKDWAEDLGISRSYLTMILNADTSDLPKHMPPMAELKLMQIAGNKVPIQWMEMYLEGRLVHQKSAEQRKSELMAELAELERQA